MALVQGQWRAGRQKNTQTDFGASSRYRSALSRSKARYGAMMEQTREAVKVSSELAPEFQQVADIFRTGGEYGTGAKTAIEKAARYGLSSSLANLGRTGMSSGSIAQGVRARYSRQATEQTQNVEDTRYQMLSSALQALAGAKEARATRTAGVYQTTAQLIAGFQEPSMGQFTNEEAIALAGLGSQEYRAKLTAESEAEQRKIYQPTAAQQLQMQNKELLYRYM